MPVADLIEKLEEKGLTVNQAHKALEACRIPNQGEVSQEDCDRVLAHISKPVKDKAAPVTKQKTPEESGALTTAHQTVSKSAITSSRKQMVRVADTAAQQGAIAFGQRYAQNLVAIADQIEAMTTTAEQIYESIEAEDDDDPLSLPPPRFSLT